MITNTLNAMQTLLPFWWPWINRYNINTKRLTNPELITLVRDSSASHCCGWKRTDLEFFRYAPPIFPINCFGISCIISFWGHESAFLEICNKLYSEYCISKQKVQLLILVILSQLLADAMKLLPVHGNKIKRP